MPETSTSTCAACGADLQLGDWPFCPHGSTRSEWAQRFEPIVIHRSADGEVRFPGSTDAAVPAGFERVELNTIQAADRFTRDMDSRERAKAQQSSEGSRIAGDHRRKVWREEMRNEVKRRGLKGALVEAAIRYGDSKRAAREQRANRATNFHIEVFANDSSNREAHCDIRTGWKDRK